MMRYIYLIILGLFFSVINMEANNSASISLVPCPTNVVPGTGSFQFTPKTVFAVETEEQADIVRLLSDQFTCAAGFTPKLKVDSKKGNLVLQTDKTIKSEAYCLEITPKKITVKASDAKGFFYALQSIRQLLPPAIESAVKVDGTEWIVPAMTITDEPRFGYRGLMVDVARFFVPKENLLRIIDCMGMLKLNTLHLHLVDDNGWRIEIKKYPLLTEIGASRVERPGKLFPERRNQRQGEPTVEKGFYTQDDIREIVAYAAARRIEVIPEIEMPAHSNAALAAYPLLACPVVDKFIGVLPGLGGNHADIIYCAGNDSVFTFLQNIIDEVVALFPSKYIHLGGDEARKTHWKVCPLCQARMKKEGLKNEEDLQGYFMARMSNYVKSKGREVMGWDELTNTKIPDGAVIFGWQGYGQAALKAARQGHRFVMTPARVLYLIRYQGPQWFEPVTYFGNNTLKDIYDYEPVERSWTTKMRSLLMGIQGSMWTEFCNKPEEVEYLIFPRLAAVAEGAWTFPVYKDWDRFLAALDNFTGHLDVKGITYARSMYNIQHKVTPMDGSLQVELECIRPDVEIRYTTNGSQPTAKSSLYERKWQVTTPQIIKSATFKNGKQMGQTLTLPIQWNKATAKRMLRSNPVERVMVNGVRGSLKYTDSEWASWTRNDSIAFTLDLRKREHLNKLVLVCINNYGMGVHKPKRVEVWLSNEDIEYWKVASKELDPEEIFREGTFIEELPFNLDDTGRYVRVILFGAGECPLTHVRPGQEARVCVDELIIE